MNRFRVALFLFACIFFIIPALAEETSAQLLNAVSDQITPTDTTFMVELDMADRLSAKDGEYEHLSRNIAFIPDCDIYNDDRTCHVAVSKNIIHIVNEGEVESSQYVTIGIMQEEAHRIILSAGHTYSFSMSIDHLESTENGGSYIWKAIPVNGEKSKTIGEELYFTNSQNTVRYFSYTPEEDMYVLLQVKFGSKKQNNFYLKIQIEEGFIYSAWTAPIDPALVSTRMEGYIDEYAYRLIKINRNDIAARLVNPLYGKTMVTFGDSIAHGSGEGNEGGASRIIALANAMNNYNYAKGGATFHTNKENNILAQIEAAHSSRPDQKPDFVLFNGYTNDILDLDNGTLQMGEISNESTTADSASDYEYKFDSTTFTGAVELTVFTLRKYYPESIIIYFSPHRMVSRTWETQLAVHDRVIEVMRKWSIPVVDLFNEGLNTFLPDMKKRYTSDTYSTGLGDGTHPNVLGYRMFYAPLIADKMRSLSPVMEEAIIYTAGSGIEEIVTDVECLAVDVDRDVLLFNDFQEQKLTVSLTPANTTNKLTWTTSDTSVITVEGNGKTVSVKPVSNGTAFIIAQCGNYQATCEVFVDVLDTEDRIQENHEFVERESSVQATGQNIDAGEKAAEDVADSSYTYIEGTLEISELCSSNKTVYVSDTGKTPDWIELHNTGSLPLDLSGWYLSNDEDEPRLFNLEGYTIQGLDYLVLRADGEELPFKLSSSGAQLILIGEDTQTTVDFPPLSADQTYSLQPDGTWHITAATPGKVNATGEPYLEPPFVAPPKFSHTAGFYDDPFDLTLSGFGDVKIYYTTDGSVPDDDSMLYTDPIHIYNRSSEPNVWSAREDITLNNSAYVTPDYLVDKCCLVRAVAVDADGNKSQVITNTYLVGLRYDNISVLSIVADPQDLFDENNGIYVRGKVYTDWLNDPSQDHAVSEYYIPTNFGKTNELSSREREIPADFQMFDDSGSLLLNQTLAIRIQGNYSRIRPQKSLKTTARKEISRDNRIAVRLWEDLPKLKQIIVRADGNMTAAPSIDVFSHLLVSDQGLITSRAKPTLLFLDGEYWGLYNLRPSLDEKYISAYIGIPDDELIMVKNNQFKAGAQYLPQYRSWHTFMREIEKMNFSQAEDYDKISSLLDLDSYIRFVTANLYLQNRDFNDVQNVTIWRTYQTDGEGYRDGRWRWMYQDMDLTCELGYETRVFDEILPNLTMLNLFWKNENFRRQFLDTLGDFMNVDCSETRIEQLTQRYVDMYGPYILDNQKRFSTNLKRSSEKMATLLRQFFKTEHETFLTRFGERMGIQEPIHSLTVTFPSADAPPLFVNNRQALYMNQQWLGYYYQGSTLTLAVSDMPSYYFLGWYDGDTLLSEDYELTLTIVEDQTISPRFEARPRLIDTTAKQKVLTQANRATLPSNDYQIKAFLTVDSGLALADDRSLVISADGKWAADTGFTLQWNSNQYANQQLFILVSSSKDAPTKWALSWSTDGVTWEKWQQMKLSEDGKTQWVVLLPAMLDDVKHAYLRFYNEKKGSGGTLTLESMILSADKLHNSLADIKEYAIRCQAIEGDDFEPPDLEALMQLSKVQLNEQETTWRNRLAQLLLAQNTGTVRQVLGNVGIYAMYSDNPTYTVTDEIVTLTKRGLVDAGNVPDGTAYLCRLEDGRITKQEQCQVENHQLEISLSRGVFVLLEDPPEKNGIEALLKKEEISQKLLDSALGGIYPQGCYQMDVIQNRFGSGFYHVDELPGNEFYGKLYVYFIVQDRALELIGSAEIHSDGGCDIPCGPVGSYLLMQEPLEDHLDEADMFNLRRQQGK